MDVFKSSGAGIMKQSSSIFPIRQNSFRTINQSIVNEKFSLQSFFTRRINLSNQYYVKLDEEE